MKTITSLRMEMITNITTIIESTNITQITNRKGAGLLISLFRMEIHTNDIKLKTTTKYRIQKK